MPDLRRLRDDLLAFSQAINWPLEPWQADALNLDRRATALVAPRQTGKSRSLAVLGLHRAYRRPTQTVLIVSAGEDASRRLLAEAATAATRSPLLAKSIVDENAGLLVLSNGSVIRSVPASERAIRGWAVDLLLVDEAAQVEDDLLLSAAIPTTAARQEGRVVLAGSPGAAEGAFFEFVSAGDEGSEHVATYRWKREKATWIQDAVVQAAREQLAPAQFEREFEGRFADVGAEERVIDQAFLEAAQRRTLDRGPNVLYAIDVARRGGDETVALALRGGVARVAFAYRGADLMQTAGRVLTTVRDAPGRVWLDAIGLGYGVLDRLREQDVRAIAFVASARPLQRERFANLRAEAWWHAREAFREGTVDLDPADRTLAAQLGVVRYSLTSNGTILIAPKESMRNSPDRADALVIALHARAQGAAAEGIARLAEHEARRQKVERAADPLLRDYGDVADLDWHGERPRRSWRAFLDPDLPSLPPIR